ncbi:peptidylprolyl isomerase [Sutterella seckii]|uniref:peptidylprolyl isomerase n=1 Tax=Sutterella seckii TaxID=1944635 RepID=UPI001D047810|nr:peptidylprolyl isomerase [Sutterella seckii]
MNFFQTLLTDSWEFTKLIERINKGEKFENLAKQYSIDPQSRDQGGLVGWLVPSNVDQAFGNAFKVLSAGSVAQAPDSQPVRLPHREA